MKLEEQFYYTYKREEKNYTIGDLERLSATQLHSFDIPMFGMKPLLPSSPLKEPKKIRPNENLTILDLPASGIQLHTHEGENGTAHLKTYSGDIIPISSYDAAMADINWEELYAAYLKEKK